MEKIKMKEEPRKKIFRVAVMTPYLYEKMSTDEYGPEFIQKQIEKYGHDPDNFNGVKYLETSERIVRLESPFDHDLKNPMMAQLIIRGSTEGSENAMRDMQGSGVVAARYSIFYGEPSGYTGRPPEHSGYALDIPKNVSTVRAMLTNDSVLGALEERDAMMTRNALAVLNATLPQPILATPFLEKALRVMR